MKKIFIFFLAVLILPVASKADEGMWLPIFVKRLNYADMQKAGCKLSPEEIYSVNNSSLKDAIVQFGGGCTGEIISSQGLLLTNHHCGLGQIQEHSSVEHDYLTNGFWAMSKDQELVNPNLSVKFLVSMEDVTKQITDSLSWDTNEEERRKIIRRISKRLADKAKEGTHLEAVVRDFFGGNEFYMFVYEEFKDVRLVGTPPWGIGKYGADTDNWMWPRHKGDFCLFRVYTAPDGSPAAYSKDNVPMKPKHHLPISLDGIEKNDYAMIMGYPGRTERYLSSYGVKLLLEQSAPTIIDVRTKKLEIYRADMDADEKVRIQYASKQARTSNYWKYSIGQVKQLKRNKIIERKQELEKEFTTWVNADEARKKKYGKTLSTLESGFSGLSEYNLADKYFMEAIYSGSELVSFINTVDRIYNTATGEFNKTALGKTINAHFKDYNAPTDEKVLAAMLHKFYNNVDPIHHPKYLTKIHKKYKGNFEAYSKKLFAKSIFVDEDKLKAKVGFGKEIVKDPAAILVKAFIDEYRKRNVIVRDLNTSIKKGERQFIAGLREMQKDKKFAPDANFTMRLTYGTVGDYRPADGVHYDYYTTLEGVMEKEVPNDWEFHVPAKLKELYEKKDYGRYANDKGELVVNFITNNDITGGNSGSPVIDAEGNLIGCAFDGNWEAMSGDISFETTTQRTICVDARYILFVIDKVAGAKNLIDELTIAK